MPSERLKYDDERRPVTAEKRTMSFACMADALAHLSGGGAPHLGALLTALLGPDAEEVPADSFLRRRTPSAVRGSRGPGVPGLQGSTGIRAQGVVQGLTPLRVVRRDVRRRSTIGYEPIACKESGLRVWARILGASTFRPGFWVRQDPLYGTRCSFPKFRRTKIGLS